jgi:2-polyprenyl-6-hydroxyphenyl methylase/3-demethylubiquinone-9 3-methyltransferase
LSSPTPFSTINYVEVSHFSRLSALWWDERDDFFLLYKMNSQRRRFIREKRSATNNLTVR